jgi:ferritin-like metal-binding protein YciE
MTHEILQELFVEQIRDLYDAEKQLLKALPKMAKAAESEELQEAIRNHLEETQNQVTRLESVFEAAGVPAKGKTCKAMKGLLEEGTEAMQEDEGEMRDLAIIAAAQRVEHYEISAYGTARTIAEHLGLEEAVDLLQETEDEEKNADTKLTEVASSIYGDIEEEDDEEMDEEGDEEAEDTVQPATAQGGKGRNGGAMKKGAVKRAGGR